LPTVTIEWLDITENALLTNMFFGVKHPLANYAKFYKDPINQRNLIYKENIEKVGVYCWFNNLNSKIYVGSGNPLYNRISDYYQKWYLESKSNLIIVKALKKYAMENFTLFILEYSNHEDLLKCEQK